MRDLYGRNSPESVWVTRNMVAFYLVDTVHVVLYAYSFFFLVHHVAAFLWGLGMGLTAYSDITSYPVLFLADITLPFYLVCLRGVCLINCDITFRRSIFSLSSCPR